MLPRLYSEPGPLLTYLSRIRPIDAAKADDVIAQVRIALATPEGAMLLMLLEEATTLLQVPVLADPRALEARNAQSFIAADLRRIMSDETEKLLERNLAAGAGRRRGQPASR